MKLINLGNKKVQLKMKKIFSALCLCLLSLNMTGQLTFEHSFNQPDNHTYPFIGADGELKYYNVDEKNGELLIFNSDYSLYKTIELIIPDGFRFPSIQYIGEDLFDKDGLIEFMLVVSKFEDGNSTDILILYNENNKVLYNFGNRDYIDMYSTNGVVTLIARQSRYDQILERYFFEDDIYTITGNITGIEIDRTSSRQMAYPNPSSNNITLPYSINGNGSSIMKIYNSSGQIVESLTLDSSKEKVILNTKRYAPDMYIYVYGDQSGKFIVQ